MASRSVTWDSRARILARSYSAITPCTCKRRLPSGVVSFIDDPGTGVHGWYGMLMALVAIVLSIPAQRLNIAFLVALAFAVAASANLPAIIYNMFWRRFNTRGAVWSIYGGLISSVGLVVFSPVVSGKLNADGTNAALLPTSIDISWFPLENPGIVSIPLAFFLGWLGTVTSKEPAAEERFTELEVRALTGLGLTLGDLFPARLDSHSPEARREAKRVMREVGWRAVHNIVPLLAQFRQNRWPVLYPHVAPKKATDAGRLAQKVPAIMGIEAWFGEMCGGWSA